MIYVYKHIVFNHIAYMFYMSITHVWLYLHYT